MRTVQIRLALAVLVATVALPAQTPGEAPPKETSPAPEEAAAPVATAMVRQRTAASAMEKSLARQRASLEKQTGQLGGGAFFVLPPPAGSKLVPAPAPAAVPARPPDPVAAADCDPLPSSEVDSLVEQSARRQDLDEDVLRGVIRQESAFRPCAVSPKGAMGLMQLMPATATQFGAPNPFDPAQNVEAGATFLKQLLVRYGGDLPMALGAYNAGPARVDAAAGVPKIPETQDYVKQIMSNLPVKH
jgi:soluble lytic murein transglycosylase-like protein